MVGGWWLVAIAIAAPTPVFAQADERVIYTSVVDRHGAQILDLTLKDFIVREDGQTREVLRVARDNDPLQIALLVDNSVSMRPRLTLLRKAVTAFIDATREDVQLARSVVPRDQGLDEMNSSAGRRLIERMAEDPNQLRGYLNLIFISRCLERVGDHATNMAEDAVYAAAAEDIRHQH